MKAEDRKAFLDLISQLHAFFKEDLTDFSGDVWKKALEPFDFKDVYRVLSNYIVDPDNSGFRRMPWPADIVKALLGSSNDRAMLAWTKVEEGGSRAGIWQDVVFDDPVIHRVILDMGGWIKLWSKELKEWPFIAKDFITRYRAHSSRRVQLDYPPVLLGMCSTDNLSKGFVIDKPIMLGELEIAKKVQKGEKFIPLVGFESQIENNCQLHLESQIKLQLIDKKISF